MPRGRNLFQLKEQEKAMGRDLTETGISKMLDKEFKATIIRILIGLEKRMEEFKEAFTPEIKELKNSKKWKIY